MSSSNPQRQSRFHQILILVVAALATVWFVGSALGNNRELSAQSEEATPTPALETEAIATPLPGAPVEVGGKVIFHVQERLGSLTTTERATLIERRINRLANDPFGAPLELKAVESLDGIDILNGDDIIITITERDVAAADLDMELHVVAGTVIAEIDNEVARTREQNTPRARLYRALEALAFLVAFIIIVIVINRIYRRLIKKVDAIPITDTPPTEEDQGRFWEGSSFYRSGAWKRLAKLALNIVRIVFLLAILIYIVPLALRIFPQTAKLATEILQLLLSPIVAFWDWLVAYQSNFFTIVMIIVITYFVIRLIRALFQEIEDGSIRFNGFDPEWASFTSRMVSFLVIIAAVIIIFPYIPGSDSAAFQGISVFLGLLFTLSSTAAVTNIVAGIIQTYTGAFRVGDLVKIEDVTGTVIEKRLLTTRVRTFKNEEVSIPNGTVLNTNVLNYTTLAKDKGLILYTTITIGYDVPWQQVQDLLIKAALAMSDVEPEPPPFVLQNNLGDFSVAYQLNCFTKAAHRMPRIYSALHASIQDRFNEANVEILSPTFSALRDGNTVTTPPDYLPDDYEVPAFRVDAASPNAPGGSKTSITLD